MNLYLRSTRFLVGIPSHTGLASRKGEGRRTVELNDEDSKAAVSQIQYQRSTSMLLWSQTVTRVTLFLKKLLPGNSFLAVNDYKPLVRINNILKK